MHYCILSKQFLRFVFLLPFTHYLVSSSFPTYLLYIALHYLHSYTHTTPMYLYTYIQMDYGYLNKFLGREVDQNFWGTRTQHIVGVAACLALTDHASQSVFAKSLGRPLCFAKSPATFVAHTFLFIFSGVVIYVAGDAAFNPLHDDSERTKALKSGTYSTYVGTCTAWFEPYVAPALARVAGPAIAATWFGSSLLPATLAYTTVKGVGWYDWGNDGLNDYELKINNLSPK
jgi:hypothetical protein